jgi:tRNA (guanine10-N2)-dimethyltransferase
MFPSLLILGRQPALGLAELERLFGSSAIQPVNGLAALLDRPPDQVPFTRLGGSIKLAKVLTQLDTIHWPELVDYLTATLPEHLNYFPAGKLKFGLSAVGFTVTAARVNASALQIKKIIKQAGRSVRIIPNNEAALNSAQVLRNQLTGELGMELVLVRNGRQTILAQTVQEQDIDAYAARDHGRPHRDAKVGMLPPKLAQIIVNLAQPSPESTLLDPFCGTGVILQEALLMGYAVKGSDIDPRMVDYTRQNLVWLLMNSPLHGGLEVEIGDATKTSWIGFDVIATETYLGRPFSAFPAAEVLQQVMQDVDTIHKKFLQNIAQQTNHDFHMCLAVPAWKTPHGFKHLKTLDNLEELGYTRLKFVHARNEDLIYHREGQVVARELVVLQRK